MASSSEEGCRTLRLAVSKPPRFSVSFEDGLLSIEAKQRPWTQVIEAIRERTGMRFHYSIALEGSVTVSFTALPIKQALERLFGLEADFVLRYPERVFQPLAVPEEVWVLGSVRGGGVQPLQSIGDQIPLETSNPSDGTRPVIEESKSTGKYAVAEDAHGGLDLNDIQVVDHLVELARDQDPATRVQALSTLSGRGKADEGAVELALDVALTDKIPSVRGSAVQALAIRRGPEAMEHLWHALEDPDPGVRIMAIESAASMEQGIILLREALSDKDELVRSIAADRLKQIRQPRAE